jgi:8-oxo-dGTP diphosphatase
MQTVVIVKALLLDSAGNMLVLRRSSTHPTLAHFPDLPGGIVEPGEELGTALTREIREETGLEIPAGALRPLYAGTEAHGNASRVRILYVGRLEGEKPQATISWEHESAEWLPLSEIETIEQAHHSFYKDALHAIRTNDLLAGLDLDR